MKLKNAVLLICFLVIATLGMAQPTVTLLTFEGYTFNEGFSTGYGSAKVYGGFQWGGGFEIGITEENAVEIIYQRLDTDAYYDWFGGNGRERIRGGVGVNYILLGGTRYLPLSDAISGFGSVDMGVMFTDPSPELQSESIARFAVGARVGLRIMATEKLSLRLHAQLLSPIQYGGFYFGTGGGGVSTSSTIFQFNLGGSVNFRIR